MKHPYLQKVTLTAMAVVASFALSAQAKGPSLSTATQTHGSKHSAGRIALSAKQAGKAQTQSPMDFVYSIDDGTAEDSIGLTTGGDVIALNSFTVVPGDESITSLDIAWGTPAFPDPSLNGLPFTACIWSDPNGDGDPSDAVLLTTASGVIADAGTDTFNPTSISATITTTKFFVGFLVTHAGGQFPAAFDETNPISNRSYIAGGASGDINNLNNNDLPVAPIESFALFGNWLIRANSGGDTTPTPTMTPTPPPGALWYNGDFDGVNGLANERDTSLGAGQYASTYDDFNVNDADGWDVHSVFSNNLENTNVVGATWEIRQGVSEGNGGTLIASGMTAAPVVTPTGRSGFGFIEQMVEVTGLDVHLPFSTDPYWLNVTPTGDLTGRSFDSTTVGASCIGTPCGNNQNAFFDSNFFGAVFTSTANQGQPSDFSMGVNGDVSGGGGGITLTATVEQKNGNSRVNLSWSPADGGDVNVLRNGRIKFTTADDGSATNNAKGHTGTITYQVCETDTGDCSNVLDVTIP